MRYRRKTNSIQNSSVFKGVVTEILNISLFENGIGSKISVDTKEMLSLSF